MTKDGDDSQSKKTTKLAKQNQARNSKPSMVTLGQLFPILNQHIQVPRLHVFNFAHVRLQCVLGMQRNSVVKTEF